MPFSLPLLWALSLPLPLPSSLSLSLYLPSQPTLPPPFTLYLSLPFLDPTMLRSRLPVLVCFPSSGRARRLSRRHVFTSTPWIFPSLPLSRSFSTLRVSSSSVPSSSASDGLLTNMRSLCLPFLDINRMRKRERVSHVHVSTDTRPKSSRWKSLPSLSHSRVTDNMAALVAQLEQACARARRLQYH